MAECAHPTPGCHEDPERHREGVAAFTVSGLFLPHHAYRAHHRWPPRGITPVGGLSGKGPGSTDMLPGDTPPAPGAVWPVGPALRRDLSPDLCRRRTPAVPCRGRPSLRPARCRGRHPREGSGEGADSRGPMADRRRRLEGVARAQPRSVFGGLATPVASPTRGWPKSGFARSGPDGGSRRCRLPPRGQPERVSRRSRRPLSSSPPPTSNATATSTIEST